MTTATSQLNIRIPMKLKLAAQKTAETKGIKLNTILNQFLYKFIENPDVVTIKHDFNMEEIFDQGVIQWLSTPKAKKTLRKINKLLDAV